MQQILNFFIRNKNALLFLLLFFISLFLTIQSHSYHRSKFVHSANFLTGGIYEQVNSIGQYFDLKSENELLLQENNRLKSLLLNQDIDSAATNMDNGLQYGFIPAKVVKSSYSSSNNYLTIDVGEKDSIVPDLGVVTSNGIIGIVDNVSKHYARVISILNTTSRVNAQHQKSGHFGSLTWNAMSPYQVQLEDIPKQAEVKSGDTIITSGRSVIFPKGIPIGKVLSYELDETENYYLVNIELFNDMTNVGHVHVIRNRDREEILSLEAPNE